MTENALSARENDIAMATIELNKKSHILEDRLVALELLVQQLRWHLVFLAKLHLSAHDQLPRALTLLIHESSVHSISWMVMNLSLSMGSQTNRNLFHALLLYSRVCFNLLLASRMKASLETG
jgi:hypothetical protein